MSDDKKPIKKDDDNQQVTKGEYLVLIVVVGGLCVLTAIYVSQLMEARGLLAPADDTVKIEHADAPFYD